MRFVTLVIRPLLCQLNADPTSFRVLFYMFFMELLRQAGPCLTLGYRSDLY